MSRFLAPPTFLALGLLTALLIAGVAVSRVEAGPPPPVDPATVDLTLAPGESAVVEKTVQVPEAPPKADVYFLADVTGSMSPVIAQVQTDAASVLSSIAGSIADVQFGAGQYRDFPFDAFAFSNDAAIGPDDGVGGTFDASDAIAALATGGGADGPEGQLFALDRIADPGDPTGIGWRSGASRIVVWFGDAPGHDPVCAAISGLGFDIDEASATAKLVAAGITVVAISTTTGFAGALDHDPLAAFGGDYVAACGAEGGAAGQATRITGATGGAHLTGVAPGDIAAAILAGISAITHDITMELVGCDPALALEATFVPPSHLGVTGPTTVNFTETVTAPADAAPGTYVCTVKVKIDGGDLATQTITVTVPGTTTPTPTPTPTAAVLPAVQTPTATLAPAPTVLAAAALPATGGEPSDGGPGALPWLAAIAGAVAAMSAGGVWLAYQWRRVR